MINVQQELESRLGEPVIFVTSYADDHIYFLAVTKEGITHTVNIAIAELGQESHYKSPLQAAVDDLYIAIKTTRQYNKAKADLESATATMLRIEAERLRSKS